MSDLARMIGTPREWAKDLAVMVGVGVFLGVIGPFGSFYGGPMELRIPYWVANMLIGFLVLSIVVRLSVTAASRLDLPVWFSMATGVAVGALPLALILRWFSAWFWPPNHGHLSPLFELYGEVLAISEPFAFVYYFVSSRGWRPAEAEPPAPAAAPAPAPPAQPGPAAAGGRFLDRLPPRLGRELICLRMEDHYVRAHTPKGSDLILIPLKDAIAELGDIDGLQVHRSWWVARSAVAEVLVSGRNLSLRLTNGLDVPVSRASVAKLRASGWLGAG
jgi:hypothetical protein